MEVADSVKLEVVLGKGDGQGDLQRAFVTSVIATEYQADWHDCWEPLRANLSSESKINGRVSLSKVDGVTSLWEGVSQP